MLCANILIAGALSFLGGIVQDALALLAQGYFDGRGYALADGDSGFDLVADRFDGVMASQEVIGQCLVFTHQTEQQMFGFDVRASVLTGLIACEENYASGFLGESLKHGGISTGPFLLHPMPHL